MTLVDTDVLIWHLRGYPSAAARLNQFDALHCSAVTYCELLQGLRNKDELAAIDAMFALRKAQIHPITEEISTRATALMKRYVLSDGLRMADALIAATCIELDAILLTGNLKHFNRIETLRVEVFVIA
jgi:predicted nucleic acid-binding protein